MSRLPVEVSRATEDALIANVNQDREGQIAAIDVLFDNDMGAVYAACVVWAEAILVFGRLRERPGFAVLETTMNGAKVDSRDVPPHLRVVVWVGQFVSARANMDHATCLALFEAATPEQCAENVVGLLDAAGSLMRPPTDAPPEGTGSV